MGYCWAVKNMDKEQLLTSITKASAARLVSEEDVRWAWHQGNGEIKQPVRKRFSFVNILYGIGGAIVAIGIVLFFQQHWQSLAPNTRILVTLGSGILLYVAGILISRTESVRGIAWAFFLAFALVTPFGVWVTFDSFHVQFPFFGYETIISCIMFIWFTASLLLLRINLFKVFAVISGSILYFGVTGDFLSKNPVLDISSAYEYRFLLLGISYVLIGYSWKNTARTLSSCIYTFGFMMFLGAAMSLGGYSPSANLFWEALFPGLALGSMFLSIPLKSRFVLVVGSLYLMGYILKITAEYFSDTVGWPIALILAGFVLIGIGYGAFMLGSRYVRSTHPAE